MRKMRIVEKKERGENREEKIMLGMQGNGGNGLEIFLGVLLIAIAKNETC